ncbi:hypothetical protein CHLRE_06g297500v5 [Chlamydomonas reinhardtii]|uniref:Uncharacterized protein n=1 Tax=Chlamydomonas reinhardtii TaxID=3055 RepID=A0A2K3DQP4_CHLRE|nr:uncharacterized protein CHLRE_06g297500v5 [Chlamydomonas reinhardtii]PNW82862.1 hypothetical protein CHLRE_06g297500v5 [Chlamydomonas reinhardtii]
MLSQSAFAPAVTQAKLAAAAPAGPDDTDGGSQAAARSSRAGAATAPPHPHPHPHPQPHDDLMTTMLHPPGHLPPHRHHPHPQRRSHTVCQPLLPGEALAAIASYGAEAEAGLVTAQRAHSATGTELGFLDAEPAEPHPHYLSTNGAEMAVAAAAAAAAAAAMAAAAKAAAAALLPAAVAAHHRGHWDREWERLQRSRSCELLHQLGGMEEDADAAAWWT